MSRKTYELNYQVEGRNVTIQAFDTVGPDDAFEMLHKSVLHRYATGEDLTPAIPRDIKDWIIKTGLYV